MLRKVFLGILCVGMLLTGVLVGRHVFPKRESPYYPEQTDVEIIDGCSSSGVPIKGGLWADITPIGENTYQLLVAGYDDQFTLRLRLELAHPIKELKPFGKADTLHFPVRPK
jgi:hypothetical protein